MLITFLTQGLSCISSLECCKGELTGIWNSPHPPPMLYGNVAPVPTSIPAKIPSHLLYIVHTQQKVSIFIMN